MINAKLGPVDRNAHVKADLTYYAGLPRAPHYAVLLDTSKNCAIPGFGRRFDAAELWRDRTGVLAV